LVCSGCSDALSSGGAARPAVTVIPEDEAELRDRIDKVRAVNLRRYMNTREHAAWQIIHGILAYQDQLKVDHVTIDPATKIEQTKREPALKLILEGGQVRGFTLRERPDGLLATEVEGGSKAGQGHPNQWLGYLLVDYPPPEGRQAPVTADTTVVYRSPTGQTRNYTIADMIKAAMQLVRDGDEGGWSLIGLTAFPDIVPLDREWEVSYESQGQAVTEKWSIEKIVAMECRDSVYPQPSSPRGIEFTIPFHETSCGGTHRLIGLSRALARYREFLQAQGRPAALEGAWRDADNIVGLGIERIRELQQGDGAFSALWLQRGSTSSDVTVRIRTTGHCLEFLALTLPQEELAKDWAARAALHLCELFEQTKDMPVDCGAAYHALHALQVYREKRWGVAK
jgi:hypothetical protein